MKKTELYNVLKLFKHFQTDVLDKQPNFKKMVEDVQMMRYKIRPLQGDISIINFSNKALVETLWQLGKMEDFIAVNSKTVKKDQEQAFFRYFDSMYRHLQEKLNNLQLIEQKPPKSFRGLLEMEIFKERRNKKKMN